jgi:hypothetical protein
MPKNYLDDRDLAFLAVENADLEPLVLYITTSPRGSRRWTERLTHQEEYKKDPSNCRAYIKDIVDDLQLYGGNTIANMSHGHGIPYRKSFA